MTVAVVGAASIAVAVVAAASVAIVVRVILPVVAFDAVAVAAAVVL
jgi:hypothetical protein